MYIDPSNLVSSTAGAAAASVAKSDDSKKRSKNRVAESRLGQEYARVLHRALAMEGSSPEEIRQVQKALEAGRYDTLEAALEAARTIIRYGI